MHEEWQKDWPEVVAFDRSSLLNALYAVGWQKQTGWWRISAPQPGQPEGDSAVAVAIFKGSYVWSFVQFEYFVQAGERLVYRGNSLERAISFFVDDDTSPLVLAPAPRYTVELNYRMPAWEMSTLYAKGQPEDDGW